MAAVYRLIPTGDLAITDHGFVIAEGVQQIRQRIASRLKFFLGEWFLDLRQGIPYFRDVLVKNPNFDVIRSLMRRVILGTPGVLSLVRFDMEFDSSTRVATFAFEAVVNGGTIVVRPEDRDFIVDISA
jgi:hypothetical protein